MTDLTAVQMRPTHPGVFIREEVLDEPGLSVSEAAEALGVRRATLSDVVNGKAAVSSLYRQKWRSGSRKPLA
jgi:addiction module HigA family antidote